MKYIYFIFLTLFTAGISSRLFEKDIRLDKTQAIKNYGTVFADKNEDIWYIVQRVYHKRQLGGTDLEYSLWREYINTTSGNFIVPYTFKNENEEGFTNLLPQSRRDFVVQCLNELEEQTDGIEFQRIQDDSNPEFDWFINIGHYDGGCWSYVGISDVAGIGKGQTLNLQYPGCTSRVIIKHEIMHALGFFHEHSRSDRDNFINIVEENIEPLYISNFYRRTETKDNGVPYDYKSIMHYGKSDFTTNGQDTIKSINPVGATFGGDVSTDIVQSDRDQISLKYRCKTSYSTTFEDTCACNPCPENWGTCNNDSECQSSLVCDPISSKCQTTVSPTSGPNGVPTAPPTIKPTKTPLNVGDTYSPTAAPTWSFRGSHTGSPTGSPTTSHDNTKLNLDSGMLVGIIFLSITFGVGFAFGLRTIS